jgi:MoaA/NifB/PqqE/SkfB family radical SAM enzyme
MVIRLSRIFKKKPRRPFRLIQIEPSLECTLDCVMCPWSELRPSNATMHWDTFARILPSLALSETVDFTGGGEPLRNPHLVEMVQAAKNAGCEVGFSTNGTRLTPQVSEQLVESGLDWISFSIDAASAELYQAIRRGARFDEVIENVSALRDLIASRQGRGPRMMMVFVMMVGELRNVHELPAFVELAHSLGVEQVIAKNLDVILKDADDQRRFFSHTAEPDQEIEQVLAEARLRAKTLGIKLRFYSLRPQEVTVCEHNPLQSLFINWEGVVSPCITLSYATSRIFDGKRIQVPCERYGDVRLDDLPEIWEKSDYRDFRSFFEARLLEERQAAIDHLLGGPVDASLELPPAPEGCRTCYYLYGI